MPGSTRRRVALACFLSFTVAPLDGAAQLGQASSGFAFARVVENAASVLVTPGPDGLDVTLGASAANIVDNPDDQWLLDFEYQASVLGTGSVNWGHGSGNLDLQTSAAPELSPPVSGTGQSLSNLETAQAGGQVHLTFTELGTITSGTLPDGTPVTVDLNGRVDSMTVVSGTLPAPDDTRAGASVEGRLLDNSGGFVAAEVLVSNNEVETKSLVSAVGHVLEIRGVFRLTAEAFAGHPQCCPGFLAQADAFIAGSGGLWLGLPAGVDFDAASGHDYTVPVPEPDASAPGLVVALALASHLTTRAASVASRSRRAPDTPVARARTS